jgi:hypothetical protein
MALQADELKRVLPKLDTRLLGEGTGRAGSG